MICCLVSVSMYLVVKNYYPQSSFHYHSSWVSYSFDKNEYFDPLPQANLYKLHKVKKNMYKLLPKFNENMYKF
jgi:hypothetical protein